MLTHATFDDVIVTAVACLPDKVSGSGTQFGFVRPLRRSNQFQPALPQEPSYRGSAEHVFLRRDAELRGELKKLDKFRTSVGRRDRAGTGAGVAGGHRPPAPLPACAAELLREHLTRRCCAAWQVCIDLKVIQWSPRRAGTLTVDVARATATVVAAGAGIRVRAGCPWALPARRCSTVRRGVDAWCGIVRARRVRRRMVRCLAG